MVDLPFHAVPVIVEDQVRLRVYRGSNLKIEIPLRQRQALVLAAQILNVTLAADHGSAPNRVVLETANEKRVAQRAKGHTHE